MQVSSLSILLQTGAKNELILGVVFVPDLSYPCPDITILKYADDIAKLTEKKDKAFDVLQAFALENKDELFARKKSLESVHGTLGFRTGTPKLKTLKGFTWGAVTNLLKEFLPSYVRTTEEPAKDKLLADREVEEVASVFSRVGIAVVQDETFYVEPKKEEV